MLCLRRKIRSNFNHVNGFAVNSQATFVVIRHCSLSRGLSRHFISLESCADLSYHNHCESENCTAFYPIKSSLAGSISEKTMDILRHSFATNGNVRTPFLLFNCEMQAASANFRFKFQFSKRQPSPLPSSLALALPMSVCIQQTQQCECRNPLIYVFIK